MLYSLKRDQLDKLSNTHFLADFLDAEMLVATFRTDPSIVKEIVPRPLVPTREPLATAFVAKYPKTNFGCVYNEGALFVHCQFKGEKGLYCLSMPVDDDMAMIGGREQFGYPKKIADRITLENNEGKVVGSVMRKGAEILRIECKIEGEAPNRFMEDLGTPTKDWDGTPCYKVISFLFKYFQSPGGASFDYLPRLIREPVLFRAQEKTQKGIGTVVLTSTPCDPLGEVTVGDMVSLFYGKMHNTMLPGKVVARTWNPRKFASHAFFKSDFAPTLIESFDPSLSESAKERMKAAKRF
jgi:acetoacetate decarboxylase